LLATKCSERTWEHIPGGSLGEKMSDEEEDVGDVSKYAPFKGYDAIDLFFSNLDVFATPYDDGDAESGPHGGMELTTKGLKKAIQATCDKTSLRPRDFLNLLRRATYKTAPWAPGEEDRHYDLKGMLRWISDTVRSIERAETRQELSFYESIEEEDKGDVSTFPSPNWKASPHADEIIAYLTNLDYPEELIEELGQAIVEGSIDNEDGMDLYDPDSIEETFGMYAPQSAEEFRDAHSKVVFAMYESVEDIGDISEFPEPTHVPIAASCGMCGSPIGPEGQDVMPEDIPASYDPDDYKHEVCMHCADRMAGEERMYVTHDMALDAGDPDLEGTLW